MATASRTSASASASASTPLTALAFISALVYREENQLNEFTNHQAFVQRVLSVSASTTSIVFVLAVFYCFLSIDPKRFVFRHHLIFFLLLFDLLKAIILLLYPARVLTHDLAYYNDNFCQVVGFFSAYAIEGADFAILSFAIHTSLLIFKPNLTFKVNGTGSTTRTEGGLYNYRWYIYGFSFLMPGLLAGLAFLNPQNRGYDSFVCWCYLPQRPVWSRFVLSWVPRYCILVVIIGIYCAIYFHVIREFKLLGGVFTTMHKRSKLVPAHSYQEERPSFFAALKFLFDRVKEFFIPELVLPEEDEEKQRHNQQAQQEQVQQQAYDLEFHRQNLENFRKRQKIIKKQMKSIFVYPLAYIFLWLFPFILHITQVNYEIHHKPIYWLNCMGAFMQPLSGFVDSLVFFYRERPWQHTIMKNFEREYGALLSESLVTGSTSTSASKTGSNSDSSPDQRVVSFGNEPNNNAAEGSHTQHPRPSQMSSLPSQNPRNQSLYSHKESVALPSPVNINDYALWRRILSSLKLPFFALPTDENVLKLQLKQLNNKLSQQQAGSRSNGSQGRRESQFPGGNYAHRGSHLYGGAGHGSNALGSGPRGPSDFSNILGGGSLDEGAFRQLDNFSFTKGGIIGNSNGVTANASSASFRSRSVSVSHASHAKSSRASLTSKRSSIGGASTRNRRLSFVDPHLMNEPVKEVADDSSSASIPVASHSGHLATHLAPPLAMTNYPFTTQKVHEKNTTPVSGIQTPYASPRTTGNLFAGGEGSGDSLKKSSNYSTNTLVGRNSESDDDLDFLQFLRQGPP